MRKLTLFVGNGSVVEVYTINASRGSTVTLADRCHWLCYSSASEGVSVNGREGERRKEKRKEGERRKGELVL